MKIDDNIQNIKEILRDPNKYQLKPEELILLQLIFECATIKKREEKRKKKKSERNKRYYIRHKNEILNRNKEMRDLYKRVKQNFL